VALGEADAVEQQALGAGLSERCTGVRQNPSVIGVWAGAA
jgi:hypothetical protein